MGPIFNTMPEAKNCATTTDSARMFTHRSPKLGAIKSSMKYSQVQFNLGKMGWSWNCIREKETHQGINWNFNMPLALEIFSLQHPSSPWSRGSTILISILRNVNRCNGKISSVLTIHKNAFTFSLSSKTNVSKAEGWECQIQGKSQDFQGRVKE